MSFGYYLVTAALALLVGAGCDDGSDGGGDGSDGGGDGSDGGAGDGGTSPFEEGAWTVFVYGHGDHNLSFSLVQDIVEMASATIDPDVRVVVLADFDASQDFDESSKYPSGAQLLWVHGAGKEPELLAEEDELNLDDPEVLSAAVADVFTHVPGRRRAVILWDHGGAWSGGFGGDRQDGTLDEGSPMAASTVAKAVRDGLEAAGIEDEIPLDIFSFDTCLMAGAEVAWEFRDLAHAYIANAEIDYGNGWDYRAFLTYLSSHQDESPAKLAAKEVELWDAHHASAGADDVLLRSHVAIDMAKFNTFGEDYHAFVAAGLLADSELSGVELGRAGYFSLPPYMNQIANPTASPELRDVGVFLSAMSAVSDDGVASAAQAAGEALEAAILARSQGDLREAAGQHGLHVSLPLAAAMTEPSIAAYETIAASWNDASSWAQALRSYAALDDGVAPTLIASIENAEDPSPSALPTVTFGSTDLDVAQAEVNLGFINPNDDDQLLMLGLIGRGALEPEAAYEFAWNGQIVTLPDGSGDVQPIFVRVWEDVGQTSEGGPGPLLATFGVVSAPGSEDALGALLFEDGDAEAGVVTLLDPPVTLSLAEVAHNFPGTTFTPIYVAVSLSTSEETVVAGLPIALDREGLPLGVEPAPAGTYAIITSADDVFGNAGVDMQVTQVLTPIEP